MIKKLLYTLGSISVFVIEWGMKPSDNCLHVGIFLFAWALISYLDYLTGEVEEIHKQIDKK
ncbi:hypothetical protein A7K95_08515 [Pediococcus parvulus]|uniref:TMhelix containing protein n=1 Tax=Pediococcus parvulus TaxID=54062 RepID=A0ABX2UEU7_9LACO|nr:hypothetical protein A7K95_08515 [Pediococcus parvulus]